jgi:hypothetical protein
VDLLVAACGSDHVALSGGSLFFVPPVVPSDRRRDSVSRNYQEGVDKRRPVQRSELVFSLAF